MRSASWWITKPNGGAVFWELGVKIRSITTHHPKWYYSSMQQKALYILGIIVVLIMGFLLFLYYTSNQQDVVVLTDYKNAEYVIDGRIIRLTNGVSEIETASGSALKITTRYFGNEVKKDLDGDGREDVAFLLTQDTGGSGTFFYVVAALNKESGYIGSQGLLLGDRIAPQTTESGNGKIVLVNYAVRAPGEPFTIRPSIGKSIWLLLDPKTMQFGEVMQNFEGEADPSRMKLDMKTWNWIKTIYNDGREILPKNAEKFTLKFLDNGTFSASTDCNGVGGNYTADKEKISFGEMISTLMYCEGSQEAEFRSFLENAQSYHFTSKGELILDLKFDSGSAVFR